MEVLPAVQRRPLRGGHRLGAVPLTVLPHGLGHWLLGPIWQHAYPLLIAQTLAMVGQCICTGAGSGLRALGAARRSLNAMVVSSAAYVVFGACMWWWHLRRGLRENEKTSRFESKAAGRHRGKTDIPPAKYQD